MVGIQVLHQYEGHASIHRQVLQQARKGFQPSRRRPDTGNQKRFMGIAITFHHRGAGAPGLTVRHGNPVPNGRNAGRFAACARSFGFGLPWVFLSRHKARSGTDAAPI